MHANQGVFNGFDADSRANRVFSALLGAVAAGVGGGGAASPAKAPGPAWASLNRVNSKIVQTYGPAAQDPL